MLHVQGEALLPLGSQSLPIILAGLGCRGSVGAFTMAPWP